MTNQEEYKYQLEMPQWAARRKEILQRDKKCLCCGARSKLQVHHRQYHIIKATGQYKAPWAYNDKTLITLCRPCHEAGHKHYKVPVLFV